MMDLYLGIAIQIMLMVGAFWLAWWLTRSASTRVCDALAAAMVIGIAVYARWFWEHPFMASLLPFSNLIVVSNWFPLAAGFLAGLVWQRIRDTPEHLPLLPFLGKVRGRPRRVFATIVLAMAGTSTMVFPLLGQPPECGADWDGDLCYQTSPATCSAAAAATLLQYYGVFASEAEMAELCLTRRGTNWKGLYRGLVLKAPLASRQVEVFNLSVDQLIEQFEHPCILQCELKLNEESSTEYERDGWVPGQPHSVVLIAMYGDRFVVFDPSVGLELDWDREAMETLWHGQGLRMIKSSPGMLTSIASW